MPKDFSPMSASPLTFRRMRLYFRALPVTGSGAVFAKVEAPESPDCDLLARLCGEFENEVFDRPSGILDERLFKETDFLIKLLKLAVRDPPDHLLGLLLVPGLGAVDLELSVDGLLRNVLAGDVARAHGRDLHREVPGEGAEVVCLRDEIRLAVHLHHRADPPPRADVSFELGRAHVGTPV